MVRAQAAGGREEGDSSPPLQLSSSNLGAFLEISPDALVLINQAGIIVLVNRQAEALFGYPHAQLLDQPLEQLLPERFRDGHREYRVRYFATPRTRPMGAKLPLFGLRKDGTEFPLDISLKPLLLDERLVALAAVRDMSTQRHMEEELIRLASIVESSDEAIFSKTLEGVITSWNRSAETLYGYRAEEIIGHSVLLLFPHDHQQELDSILARIKLGQAIKDHETTRVRKDGTPVAVSNTISPIPDRQGRIAGASTIAHDITGRRRAEDALRRSRDELVTVNAALEQANLARSQFLSTMSHELRTPLTAILGFSEMLLEDAGAAGWNQKQQSDMEKILKNSKHLLDLINDVLDLSEIEAGRMVATYSQVDLRELLNSVTEDIQSLAIARHLFLRTEVEEGIDRLETDPVKLRRILLNLVSNALKFTEQGGATLSANRVFLSGGWTEGIAFAVKDTGIGISPDLQERIFEAFYQADMGYTRKVGGTGLGLAIVSQLTALLGGTIAVESTPGQGSIFTVILPVRAVHRFVG